MTGEAWRQRREAAGMTLRELARRAGISAPFVSDVEHGRRRFSPEVEAEVRKVLGMEPASLEEEGPRCRVCGGKIVQTSHTRIVGVIRYGGANQTATVHAIYCRDCGVSYHHLPEATEGDDK